MQRDWNTLAVRHDAARAVLELRIAQPPLNLLNQELRRELGSFFLELPSATGVRSVVFASGERSFCAGADLKEYPLRFDPAVARAHVENAHRMILALVECDTPVVAAVRGPCMGGGLELALACGYRIAARSATFALPEVKRGAWPGTGGVPLLARLVGPSVARRLLCTGETLTAAEALRLGVVDEVVEDEALEPRAHALATDFAQQPASSVRTITDLLDGAFRQAFCEHLRHEAECFVRAYQLPAAREGYQAFFEKRAPRWPQP
ncbi:MAG: enoyl-CoA hydratase/isomerase family protein [Ramlibacter sp.]